MTEYHTIYKGPEGESTKWDDIQRKLGNKPPKVGVQPPHPWHVGTARQTLAAAGAGGGGGGSRGQQVAGSGICSQSAWAAPVRYIQQSSGNSGRSHLHLTPIHPHPPPACRPQTHTLCAAPLTPTAQEPVWKPDAYTPEEEEAPKGARGAAWLEGKGADELEELEDECADDRFMEEYR